MSAAGSDPADRVSLDESVNRLLLVVLESLTPEQRVPFILHDVLGVPFGEVAEVVGGSTESSRRLARSARRQIQHHEELRMAGPSHRRLLRRLLAGLEACDEQAVRATLCGNVDMMIDAGGGGEAADAATAVRGSRQAARRLVQLVAGTPTTTAAERQVNGRAGIVFSRANRVVGVLSAEPGIDDDTAVEAFATIWIVIDPGKLGHWNAE